MKFGKTNETNEPNETKESKGKLKGKFTELFKGKKKSVLFLILAGTLAGAMIIVSATRCAANNEDDSTSSETSSVVEQDTYYTVTFDVDGGSAVSSATVLSGETLSQPETNPTKPGCVFVGWYTNKSYTTPFAFGVTKVTADTTIYARFIQVEAEAAKHTISYVVDGAVYETAETVNGAIYQMPTPEKEGAKFVGWWKSDYKDANKLTAKMEDGTEISEDITLYAVWESDAPSVSVVGNTIIWTSKGVGNQYAVKVKAPNGSVVADTVTPQSSYTFDFASAAEGDYVVEITVNGNTTKAYFKNKLLAKVNGFAYDGSVLVWNAVPNATSYLVSVECGDSSHVHVDEVKTLTFYDFQNCAMKADGIKFTVKAVANGYMTSDAAEYVVVKNLDAVANLAYDDATATFTWDAVANATSYTVTVNGTEYTQATNSFNVKNLTGEIVIQVVPAAFGYNSPAATELTATKATLATPTNIKLAGSTLTWDAVSGATGYIVTINDKEYNVTEASFDVLTADNIAADAKECSVKVTAIGADATKNSVASDVIKVGFGVMSDSLVYADGQVSWQPVINATKYEVQVNGGLIEEFDGDVDAAPIVLTKKGENVISVRCCNSTGEYSEWVSTKVEAYKISFDMSPTPEKKDSVYLATGDTFDLPENVKTTGYVFNGWFNAETNGVKYEGTSFKFEGTEDQVVYAYWTANTYEITYKYKVNGEWKEGKQEVTYGQPYTMPNLAEYSTADMIFLGWYSEENGQGIEYTDDQGNSLEIWTYTSDTTVYASVAEAFEYVEITTAGGQRGYSVMAGEKFGDFTEVKIPAVYNGLPVAWIDANAFANCANIKKISIPDSIERIYLGLDGAYSGAGSAFYKCSKLEEINIYDASDAFDYNYEKYFESIDGALIHLTEGHKELSFVSVTKTGEYRIPDGVTSLAINLFKSYKNFDKVIVPASVSKINDGAFEGCSAAEIIIEDGEGAAEITLGKNVFRWTDMEKFHIPARMGVIDDVNQFFYQCDMLKEITASENNVNYSAQNGILFDASGETLLYCPRGVAGTVEIPNGTKTIATEAFGFIRLDQGGAIDACDNIQKIIIPASVTKIDASAFEKCPTLMEVEFLGEAGDELINIGSRAFYGTNLTNLELPANTGKVEANAFGGIKSLTTVSILAGAGFEIAGGAFEDSNTGAYYVTMLKLGKEVPAFDVNGVFGPTKLTKLEFIEGENDNMELQDDVLFTKGWTAILYYPATKMDETYEIPETVTSIGGNVFNGKSIVNVVIPFSVTTIGDSAFANCARLTSVTFATSEGATHEGLTIGASAFANSNNLSAIELPAYTEIIGASAFAGTAISGTFTVPEGVTSIGEMAFANCVNVTAIELPASLEELVITTDKNKTYSQVKTFDGCTSLQSITVAAGNTKYATENGILYALVDGVKTDLMYCPANYEIAGGEMEILGTVRKIYAYAFLNNGSITEITFANAVMAEGEDTLAITIEKNAFQNAKALTRVELPTGLAAINGALFSGCSALEYVFIPNTVNNISQSSPFSGCSALTDLIFEEGNETNTLTIKGGNSYAFTGSAAMFGLTSMTEITLPERLDAVDYYLFYGCSSLKTVNIPASVTTIRNSAFSGCANLENVNIAQGDGANALTFGSSLFVGTKVSSIDLPDRTTAIGGTMFKGTKITSISIPENVTAINANAFQYCYDLTEVIFEGESKLKTIGNYAFAGTALTSFDVPATVETIGQYAFAFATELTEINFAENCALKKIDSYAFRQSGITELILPTSTNNITLGASLFQYCTDITKIYLSKSVISAANSFTSCGSLKTVEIANENVNFKVVGNTIYNANETAVQFIYAPVATEEGVYRIANGIEEIGAGAFKGQADIVTLYIPASVKKIGDNAFQACVNLKEVIFENADDSQLASIGKNAFDNCSSLTTIKLPVATTTISDNAFLNCVALKEIEILGVTTIGNYAFRNCTALEEVEFNSTITKIGTYAFRDSGLTKVTVPASLTPVKNITSNSVSYNVGIFSNCQQLTEVTIENGVTQLVYGMFSGCTALESLDVPESVTAFGTYALSNTGLKSFTFKHSSPTINTYLFKDCTQLETVNLPAAATMLPAYMFDGCTSLGAKAADGESGIVIPDTVTDVRNYVFRNCTSLKYIKFPDGITFFGAAAKWSASAASCILQGCTSLEKITLPANLAQIGNYAFEGCINLKTIENLNNVTTVNVSVFRNTGIESISLPKVTSLGNYAFAGCTNLSFVSLNGDLTALKNYTFMDCVNLTSFEIPGMVNTLNAGVFMGSGLESIIIPNSVSAIAAEMFMGCVNLTSVQIEGDVISIGESAFENCTSLTTFDMPDNLLSIGDKAFKATALTAVELPATLNEIGYKAFADCEKLATFEINAENPYYKVENNVIVKETGEYVYALPTYTVVDGVLTITDDSNITAANNQAPFAGNTSIKEVVVTAAWTEVPAEFFSGMRGLTKVTLPATVTSIGAYAFADATALQEVVMPSVATIDEYAFYGCTALTTIELPATITTLGSYVFAESGLTSVNVPASIQTIPEYAFYNTKALTTVTLNEGLDKIGVFAFAESAIQEITIPASVTMMGSTYLVTEPGSNGTSNLNRSYAFFNCTSLKKAVFLGENPTLTASIFEGCTALDDVTLPSKVEFIGDYMFYGCTALQTIDIPNTVTEIGGYAFAYSGLTSITLPESLTVIGTPINALNSNVADANNPYITGATEKNPILANPNGYTFAGCENLESVTILGDVTYVGWYSFEGCTKLSTINLPDTVEVIGDYAFANCTSLTTLELPASLLFVGNYAFENAAIISVVVPVNAIVLNGAFAGWTEAQTINTVATAYGVSSIWNAAWNQGSNAKTVWAYVKD